MSVNTMTPPLKAEIQQSRHDSGHRVELANVGVKYRLLTEEQRTLSGRLANLFRPDPAAEFWALRNISLSIKPGEVVGFVGRNGSGKSTLLRVISGILAPTEGSVTVVGQVNPMLELGGALNGELTGRENVYLNASIYKFTRAQTDELMPKIVAFSDLDLFFDIPVKTYSSGMGARLAFAMNTILTPDILILDEIMAVGDEAFQRKSYMHVQKLIEKGSIVLMVAHSAPMIEQFCNRVVYLRKGELVADGNPRQTLAQYQRDTASYLG